MKKCTVDYCLWFFVLGFFYISGFSRQMIVRYFPQSIIDTARGKHHLIHLLDKNNEFDLLPMKAKVVCSYLKKHNVKFFTLETALQQDAELFQRISEGCYPHLQDEKSNLYISINPTLPKECQLMHSSQGINFAHCP